MEGVWERRWILGVKDKMLRVFKGGYQPEIVGNELVELIEEFFEVSVKGLIAREDILGCCGRDFYRDIPVEDVEVGTTVDTVVSGMDVWVIELVSRIHTNQ